MTEEEKRAAIQFFGSLHAQATQTDQNIIGRSPFVSPISPTIKDHFEQVLHAPVVQTPAFIPPPVETVAPAQPEYVFKHTPTEYELVQDQSQKDALVAELAEIKQLLKDILETQLLSVKIQDLQIKTLDKLTPNKLEVS
jgi:hypothetical protein